MSKKPELAYWKIRGLAEPIRLLLRYVSEDYTEKLFEQGDGPEFSRECWYSVKHDFGLDFPNLPYYIDGDNKISQSNAILRYIARKHNLLGESEKDKILVDVMENQAMDFRNGFVRLCYGPNYDKNKPEYLKSVHTSLQDFEKYLGKHTWFGGEKVTFVDFPMYELLDQHKAFDCKLLENYPKLNAFLKRFEELPKIKAYHQSKEYVKLPINNKVAHFQ
ncbi:glutathione S-transferase Mu 3-like [Octopus vulgaris]|uniref:glutathione transferase n=1 Tax=Octopus vulgaris TaxID=6645 RepID=A0AA36BV51_OCTVU|nr:glutathione S-transferase Mu 3-like [Octopus vulgaris]